MSIILVLQSSNVEASRGALYYCVVLSGFILSILGNVIELVCQSPPFMAYW